MSDKGGLRWIVFTELAVKVVEPAATPCALTSFSEKGNMIVSHLQNFSSPLLKEAKQQKWLMD